MKRLGILAALLGILFITPSTALAQVRGVYWATSGFFGPFNIQGLIPSIPKEKARDITIPVSMWIIDHPKGLVVFDTGNNNAVSDGKWSRVGSSNLNLASWIGNYELDAVIEDERFAAALEEMYLTDLGNSTEIVLSMRSLSRL